MDLSTGLKCPRLSCPLGLPHHGGSALKASAAATLPRLALGLGGGLAAPPLAPVRALVSGSSSSKLSPGHSFAVPATPRNTVLAHLRGNSTAERGIPSILQRADERIASDVLELMGWTPMIELNKTKEDSGARIVAKLEYYQPLCSIKDRPALSMIEDAEEKGLITPGISTLVEMTSGNTGIGLAYVAALKGYKFIAIMPAGYSMDKQTLLIYLGASVELTDPGLGSRGIALKLRELRRKDPNLFYLDQFNNPANRDAHVEATGPEIWRDTAGHVDIFVAASGTGGTVSGVGRYLKAQNPDVKVICVEPAESRVLSGYKAQKHRIQGVGPGSVPKNFDRTVVDEIIPVTSDAAIKNARRLATEGLLVGISSGANMAACLEVAARQENKGKMVVTVFPSGAERYMSSDLFEEARMVAQGLTF